MAEESGSVLEARKSAVRLYQTPFTSRLWRPFLEIQSPRGAFSVFGPSPTAIGGVRSGSAAAARASSSKRPSRCASTAKRGAMESSEALASTFVASKYISSPRTSPASAHISTISSKKRLKTERPKRSRVRVRLEWSGRGSWRSYPRYQRTERRSAATRISSRSERKPSKKRTICKRKKTTGSTDGLPPRAYKGRTKSLTNERSNAASSRL